MIKRNKLNNQVQYLLSIKKYGRHQILVDNLSRKLNEIKTITANNLQLQKNKLADQNLKLSNISLQIKSRIELLSHLEEKTILLDPVNTLKRGYSITRVNGKAITDVNQALPETKLETQLVNGVVISTVEAN
jgi:exodeoxyribonuclease VII large subunit